MLARCHPLRAHAATRTSAPSTSAAVRPPSRRCVGRATRAEGTHANAALMGQRPKGDADASTVTSLPPTRLKGSAKAHLGGGGEESTSPMRPKGTTAEARRSGEWCMDSP